MCNSNLTVGFLLRCNEHQPFPVVVLDIDRACHQICVVKILNDVCHILRNSFQWLFSEHIGNHKVCAVIAMIMNKVAKVATEIDCQVLFADGPFQLIVAIHEIFVTDFSFLQEYWREVWQ